MGSTILYQPMNSYLENKIKIRHIIPYRTDHQSKYQYAKVYYNAYWNMSFKVLSVKYVDDLLEAEVRWDDGCYGVICTDISPGEDYLLIKDYKGLHTKDNIIGTGETFTGAEIVYWFYVHGITIFDNKYKGFWEYVDNFSQNRLQDYNQYQLYGELKHGVWKNCRVRKVKVARRR